MAEGRDNGKCVDMRVRKQLGRIKKRLSSSSDPGSFCRSSESSAASPRPLQSSPQSSLPSSTHL
eukprot:44040-Pyramimonas_sp.AAC.1